MTSALAKASAFAFSTLPSAQLSASALETAAASLRLSIYLQKGYFLIQYYYAGLLIEIKALYSNSAPH